MPTVYHRDDNGAPSYAFSASSSSPAHFSALKTILKACLVSGYGSKPAAGWTLVAEGDQYLVLTTLTFLALALFPRYFDGINGSQEIGTFLIYLFFVVIGIPASIPLIVQNAPLLLVFVAVIVIVNLTVSLTAGKLLKYDLEEILLVVNANVGGPTTAAAMAIAKGWRELIGPILVVGTIGYVIGNYLGTTLGLWFATMM